MNVKELHEVSLILDRETAGLQLSALIRNGKLIDVSIHIDVHKDSSLTPEWKKISLPNPDGQSSLRILRIACETMDQEISKYLKKENNS